MGKEHILYFLAIKERLELDNGNLAHVGLTFESFLLLTSALNIIFVMFYGDVTVLKTLFLNSVSQVILQSGHIFHFPFCFQK